MGTRIGMRLRNGDGD
ncbi:hypothetical protein Tco_0638822, partial [Tanacetum coccineum]